MKTRKRWTKELAALEAKKYQSRSEFNSKSKNAYHFAWSNRLLDEICSHMEISSKYSHKKWDCNSAFAEAIKFKSKSEFKKENSGAYCFLLNNGLLEKACTHMNVGKIILTPDKVSEIAKKYQTRYEFKLNDRNAWSYACKNNIMEEVCRHMPPLKRWNKKSIFEIAEQCQTLAEFREKHAGAYKYAWEKNLLESLAPIFQPNNCGFKRLNQTILYHIIIETKCNQVLHKIGVTNRTAKARLNGMGLFQGHKSEIKREIVYQNGAEALAAERRIRRNFNQFLYKGEPIMKNGNTELYTANVFEMMS